MSLSFELLQCPNCNLKTAIQRCFGKRGHCMNCGHDWSLKWKGGKSFSSKTRIVYA